MTATLEEAVKQDIDTYLNKLKEMSFQLGYETARNDFYESRKEMEKLAYEEGYKAAKEEFNIPAIPIDFIKKKIDNYNNHIQAQEGNLDESLLWGEKMMAIGMDTILELWKKECEQALS